MSRPTILHPLGNTHKGSYENPRAVADADRDKCGQERPSPAKIGVVVRRIGTLLNPARTPSDDLRDVAEPQKVDGRVGFENVTVGAISFIPRLSRAVLADPGSVRTVLLAPLGALAICHYP